MSQSLLALMTLVVGPATLGGQSRVTPFARMPHDTVRLDFARGVSVSLSSAPSPSSASEPWIGWPIVAGLGIGTADGCSAH